MDIKEIVNSRTGKLAAAATAAANGAAQDMHLLHSISQANSFPVSENGSDRGNSPHDSEHSRYSASRHMNGNMVARYPSPAMQTPHPMQQQQQQQPMQQQQQPPMQHLQQPMHQMQAMSQQQPYHAENGFNQNAMMPQDNRQQPLRPAGEAAPKAFPCSTCQKGFARRSDLARHERIHSGIRPHVCDHPGCHKQFIQRSALTVHQRVHTGEKPHMCERCGKPFSDSSSLARHRRIHSGKRPYQCPYADCQKTFTRRTTLTRHQNHHTGTVEEAAAATAAALATRGGGSQRGGRNRSDGEPYSNNGSPMSTPSPGQRHLSASPNSDLAPMNQMRHPGDYQPYMNNSSLPGHLRPDYQVQNQPPPTSAAYSNGMRPTSHPTGYGPPSILEPPAHMDQRQQSGSAAGSPHMGSVGWQSPSHSNMPSPSQANGYVYPDPDPYGGAGGPMYYPNSNARRPQSTEPDAYDIKPRMNQPEMWTAAQ